MLGIPRNSVIRRMQNNIYIHIYANCCITSLYANYNYIVHVPLDICS